jgi:hypothetical protein
MAKKKTPSANQPAPATAAAAYTPGTETFEHNGQKYSILLGRVNIPGIGVRTAAEIAVDEAAQAALVEIGCVGSVLAEIV